MNYHEAVRKHLIRLFIASFIACLQNMPVAGQELHFQFSRLDISHGLSNNEVTSFLKDKKGFLWIGTMSGLNRYDGYQFRIFRHDTRDTASLADDYISRIMEGPADNIWVQTRSGFNVFDPSLEKFDRNPAAQLRKLGLPAGTVTEIVKTTDGDFLFLIDQRLIYKYIVANARATLLYDAGNPGSLISALAEDSKKQYWIIHQNATAKSLDAKTGKINAVIDLPTMTYGTETIAYRLFIDSDDELWVYGLPYFAGVLRYNPATGEHVTLEKDRGNPRLNNRLVVGIQQDNNGNTWICTDHGGINVYNKKENTIQHLLNNIDDDKSLGQNSITTVYKDDAGIIWVGTYKKGISYYHKNIIKFPVYRHQPSHPLSLSYDDVNRFVEDAKGNIWIGTNGGGLLYFDRTHNKFTQYLHQPGNPNSISNNVIVSLFIDRQQRLWIGSYFGGLDCFENGKFTHYRHDASNPASLSDDRVWEIFEDSKNNLWVGTLSGGLDRFDRDKKIFHHYNNAIPNSLHSNYIAAIEEDREGKLWIGLDTGIDVLDNSTGQVVYYQNYSGSAGSISNNNVLSIFEDSRGLMWIGTRDGLNVFNKGKNTFQSFRIENGLPDNIILNILEDNNGRLWISTKNGVSHVSILNTGNPDAPVAISCTNYDELDGLQGTEFNENAALKTSKGEIVLGGPNGFNLFHPANIIADRSLPLPVFTGLQIFNKSVGIGEEINGQIILPQSISRTSSITLRYNENILAIEFAAMNFFNPEKIKYAYMLDGFNKDWVLTDGKMRKAVYTNLDPGIYTFRLKASGVNGKEFGKETTLTIRILPPFWRTPLAFVIYIAIIVLALWMARKITVERTRMRVEVEHQRQEAERVQALDAMKTKFFTNVSHEFRTPLSLILSPLDKIIKKSPDAEQKKQLHLVQRNAKRLLNLVNQLLDFRKMEVQEFRVQLSKDDIVRFTKEIIHSFSDISEKKGIELSFQSDTGSLFTLFDKDKLEKILFNLLSNAFKYTPQNGKVQVNMYYHDTGDNGMAHPFVIIKVHDTGIGIPADMQEKIFERYFQHELPGNMHNYGTGIGLAIAKEFVKLHNGSIAVESEPEKGSCFTITLPVITDEKPQAPEESQASTLVPVQQTSLRMEIEENGLSAHPKKNTILLVEDNEDFRFYLKDNLKHRYHVIEAVNGKEAWEKVRHLHPDLVVSDIMMPVMNGIELSRKIKNDPHSSHIPVVLLTAMTAVETELEGFQAGANDYITKPFTFEILASRIKNMFNLQEQLRKKFQKLVEVNPGEITITPVDEDFMKRALGTVEKNINNPEFSVEDLSRELFMSRVALYKKILSLTGKPPIEFIRIMRLKRAAQLLKKSQMTIAEVAYEVGFNNPKVFTRYFKEEFKVTPSQYQAENGRHRATDK